MTHFFFAADITFLNITFVLEAMMFLRKAMNFEPFMANFHGKFQPVNFASTLLINGEITYKQLQSACLLLQKRHPLLRAKVDWNELKNPYLIENDSPIPIKELTGRSGCCNRQNNGMYDHWNIVLENEVGVVFDIENSPFVRFVLLREDDSERSALMLICDHMSLDAEAAVVILKDLLGYLQFPDSKVETYPILGSMTSLLNEETLEITKNYYHSTFLKEMENRKKQAVEQGEKRDYSAPPTREFNFQMLSWSLNKSMTESLITGCRSYGVTVHTALAAAFLKAFYSLEGPEERSERILQFPVSARKFMKNSMDDKLGCYISIEMIPVDCSPRRDFWEICKEMKKNIAQALSSGKTFSLSYFINEFLKEDQNYVEQFKTLPPRRSKDSYEFSLSNIGRQTLDPKYGALEVLGLFAPTFSAVDEKVIGVNSTNGEMFFTLIFDDQTFDKKSGAIIRDLAIKYIHEALGIK